MYFIINQSSLSRDPEIAQHRFNNLVADETADPLYILLQREAELELDEDWPTSQSNG